ncbi:unnamed protein product [Leptosia nina]|uniref:DM13 domain-containing protein n=1 Tax=Leptosia nina TaxID=320188 RepID=A0AAV1IW88_9NEOP
MIVSAAILLLLATGGTAGRHFGAQVGALSQLQHGVRGTVYAVDSRTIFLKDFHYDGVGPAAYFYVGTSKSPSAQGGVRLRDERGQSAPLRKYRGDGVTLSLPDGKTLKDFSWFAVWCDDYSVNFGSVEIPRGLEYPKPAKVGALRGVHAVASDPIVVVDAQTLLIPNFSYDGEAPDAKFWVGRGDKPSPEGIRIPDENGKETPLRKYDKKTIVLTLPGELTVFDIGHFAIWCEAFTVNFGHVVLPRATLANVPPSLKMLGVSPQSRNKQPTTGQRTSSARPHKSLARLDATTYRPSRLGAGPRDVLDAVVPHVHRRADRSNARDDARSRDGSMRKDDETEKGAANEEKYEVEIVPQTFTLLDPVTRELLAEHFRNEERHRELQRQFDELSRRQESEERRFDLDPFGGSRP